MSVLGDLGGGSTDLEVWVNLGRAGPWPGQGWGPAEPGPQDREDWCEPSRAFAGSALPGLG